MEDGRACSNGDRPSDSADRLRRDSEGRPHSDPAEDLPGLAAPDSPIIEPRSTRDCSPSHCRERRPRLVRFARPFATVIRQMCGRGRTPGGQDRPRPGADDGTREPAVIVSLTRSPPLIDTGRDRRGRSGDRFESCGCPAPHGRISTPGTSKRASCGAVRLYT